MLMYFWLFINWYYKAKSSIGVHTSHEDHTTLIPVRYLGDGALLTSNDIQPHELVHRLIVLIRC